MPKKNLYVKEKDLKVFDTAEMVGGDSLSNIVIDALNLYIKEKKIKDEGFDKITINTGQKEGDTLKIRKVYFYGKFLSGFEYVDDEDVYYNISIYRTIKDKILIYKHISFIGKREDIYEYFIYDNLELAKEHNYISQEAYDEAIRALENETMIYLDV